MIIEVVGTVVLLGVGHYGRKVPDLLRHVSRNGLDISGSWRMEHLGDPTDGKGIEEKWMTTIELKQMGQLISGKAVMTSEDPGYPTVTLKIEGKFFNNYLDAVFRDEDRDRLNRSSFLMTVSDGGSVLHGFRVFIGRHLDLTRAVECRWVRSRGGGSPCHRS